MGVLDKIFNRKTAASTAALLTIPNGAQATNKPPIPNNTNTPPTKELKLSQSQPTLEKQVKIAGLGKITITSPEKQPPITNAADFDEDGNPVQHIKKTPEAERISDSIIEETRSNFRNNSPQEQIAPNQSDFNKMKQSSNEIYIDEKTGKKYEIPHGYKFQELPNGTVSFIPETIQDYRDKGAAVLRDKQHRHERSNNSQPKPTKEETLPQNNNTESQPTSDATQILNGETPLTADVSNGRPLEVGGGEINWGHLGFDSPQTSPQPEKNNQQPEHNNQKDKNIPSNKKEKKPSIPNGVTMGYTANDTSTTLDLTDQLNKPGASSYPDNNFKTPESTPLQDNKDVNKKNKNNPITPNQQSPIDNSTPTEPSHEKTPHKQPEKVDGPTAIAFKEENKPGNQDIEQPSEQLEQITTIVDRIRPEKLGASGIKQLLKLGATFTTIALTALNADNTTAGTLNHQDINNNPTEHTLNNTQKNPDRAAQQAWLDFLNYPAKHHLEKVTPEQFLKQYGNKYPTVSADDLRNLIDKMGVSANGRLNRYPKSPRFSTKDSTGATLKGLPNLPKAKTPNTKIKFGIGNNNNNNNQYSAPETPQNLNFNPGQKSGNWNIHKNGSVPGVSNYDIDSKGNMLNTPDIEPEATVGIGGFQNE